MLDYLDALPDIQFYGFFIVVLVAAIVADWRKQ